MLWIDNKQEFLIGVATATKEDESVGGLSALRNVGRSTKDGILGTASAPIHMVTAEGGQFKDQLWRTFRTIALAFLLVSGVGALIEDRGISKGITPSFFQLVHHKKKCDLCASTNG